MASAGKDGDEDEGQRNVSSDVDRSSEDKQDASSSTVGANGSEGTAESPASLPEQREFVRKYVMPQLVKGEEWFLLEQRWYRQWKKYVGYDCWDTDEAGERSSHPGPIDLSPLYKDFTDDGDSGTLKSALLEEMDYYLVPKLVWEKLLAWYGLAEGSTPICRRVVEFGMFTKHCKVEVYLMEFQLAKLGEENTVVTEYFSRADTIEQIKQMTKDVLGIPKDKECRLYNRFVLSNLELLKNEKETVQEVGLYSGQLLVIEQKKEDGTWPREEVSSLSVTSTYSSPSSSSSQYNTGSSYNSVNSGSMYGATSSSSSSLFGSWGSRWSSTSRPNKPGLCGLSNLGNTCFMNSALQCMSNTAVLTEYFKGGLYEQDINTQNPLGMKGEIATSYAKLLVDMWSGASSSVAPRGFKLSVSRFAPQFSGFAQHDSHELLAFLLDGLHEDLNRVKKKPYVELKDSDGRDDHVVAEEAWENHLKRNKSIIVDLFQGQFKSTLVCPDCQTISVTFDPFMFLSLPLPTAKTRQLEVLLIRMNSRPMMYNVAVPKAGAVRDLKGILSAKYSVPADHLVVTDVYNHRFYKQFQDSEPLSGIQDRDSIYVYEIPVSPDDPDTVVLPVYHRQPRPSYNYYSSSMSLTLCGLPFLIAVSRKTTTYRSLYKALLVQLRNVIRTTDCNSVDAPLTGTPTLLELSRKDKNEVTDNRDAVEMQDMHSSSNAADGAEKKDSVDDDPMDEGQGTVSGGTDANGKNTVETDPVDVGHNTGAGSADIDSNKNEVDDDAMDVSPDTDPGSPDAGSALSNDSAVAGADTNDATATETSNKMGSTSNVDDLKSTNTDQRDLFTISSVNSYGSTSLENLRDSDVPLRLSNRTYLSLDWPKDNWAYQEEDALLFDTHESCQIRSPSQPKKVYNLYDCLKLFTTKEQLGEDDPWYCPKCQKHQQASKKFDIWKLPEILVVHLKRFSYTRYWRDKLDTLIDFPVTGLDLSSACLNSHEQSSVYDLHAISNHYGGLGGGHYTAYAKNVKEGTWHYFDDSSVSSADESQLVSKAAYVLFYTRRKAEETKESASKEVSGTDSSVDT